MNPSNSTIAGAAIGVPVAVILSWILNTFFNVVVPGPVEAAMGALVGTASGYFFKGGQNAHVQ